MDRRLTRVALAAFGALALTLPLSSAQQQGGGAPYVQDEPRQLARVAYFSNAGLAGEYAIEYGKPKWQADYDKDFAKLTQGKRLRLGKDWWTSLNTFCPLTIGGKELKPGTYYLALECSKKNEWSLVALDPKTVFDQRIDAFATDQTHGGQNLPMKYEETKDAADQLTIKFVQDAKDTRLQTLEIHFGKHQLTAAVTPKV
jgi:hypothetical protein